MPAAAVASMAKKAGVSVSTAEKRWDNAKASAKKAGRADDYAYIMGIFKKMMGQSEGHMWPFGFGEALIECKLRERCNAREEIEAVAQGDYRVRAFLDCGHVCFASPNDVTLEISEDPRLEFIHDTVNGIQWPEGHPIYKVVDNYEGSLQTLFTEVARVANVSEVMKPRRKSLEQKQGHRKAGRTLQRNMKAESSGSAGYLYYYYYKQRKRDDGNSSSR